MGFLPVFEAPVPESYSRVSLASTWLQLVDFNEDEEGGGQSYDRMFLEARGEPARREEM